MEKEGADGLTDLHRYQHLMYIINRGILKHRSRTHVLMLAFDRRNDAGRSVYDWDSKSWPEQVIDNPV